MTLGGVISGEESAVTGTVGLTDSHNNAVNLVYNTAAGSYAESVTGLTGSASGNYVLASSGNTVGTLTISPKTLTYNVAGVTSTYGTLASPSVTLGGVISGDESTVTGTVGLTDSHNNAVNLVYNTAAGSYAESVTGLTGSASGNYVLASSGNTGGTLTISPKTLTYNVAGATSTYGTLATTGVVTLGGVISGDESTVTGTVGLADSHNNAVNLVYNTAAGSYAESVTGLTGSASGNYVLASSGNTVGTLIISPKALNYSVANSTSTYGTLAAPSVTLGGVISGDESTVTGTVGLTDSHNNAVNLVYNTAAGSYAESVTGLTGSASGNYVLASSGNTGGTLTISPKTLTYNVAGATSTYGTLATTGVVTLGGVISGEESAVTGTVGLTDSHNNAVNLVYNTAAGSYAESVTGLTGSASGNYVLASSGNTAGTLTISPKTLTYNVAGATSTYGTLASPSVTLGGVISGEESAVTGTVGLTDSHNNAVNLVYNTAAGSYAESVTGLTGSASGQLCPGKQWQYRRHADN